MCGIAGILNLHQPQPVVLSDLQRMNAIMQHRGPDESGAYIDDRIALGHNRLSILDLNHGIQPVHNEDKSLWIIYNGEIFNFPELRQKLVKSGHRFYTHTDTEVILHLYEEAGVNCLQDLNGQFALAIWDSKKKTLFLARDRFGIVPLYYTVSADRFIFASEIKALLCHEHIKREFDYRSLAQIMTLWTPLPDKTIFKDISAFRPGFYVLIHDGKIDLQQYWKPDFTVAEEYKDDNFLQFIEETKELFDDAVKIRLRADVPVGSYLSGGIDSSAITATIKTKFNNRLSSFGINFAHPDFDESRYQQMMIDHLGIDHVNLTIKNEDIAANFADSIWFGEQPLLRTAPVPLYLLSRIVNEHGYKVVLTGEGSDEIFAGYNIFRETKVRQFWARQPESPWRPLLLRRLYPYIFKDAKLASLQQVFFKRGLNEFDQPFFSHLVRWQNTGKIRKFLSADVQEMNNNYNCLEELPAYLPPEFNNWNYLNRAQYLEILLFLSNYLLTSQGDRMAMAHSVEIRIPFLDHRLVEKLNSVPAHWKISGLKEKYIVKKMFDKLLPAEIINRPKQPYRAPITEGLLNSGFKQMDSFIAPAQLKQTGLFDVQKVQSLVEKLKKGLATAGEVDNMALALILSTQILYDKFIRQIPNYQLLITNYQFTYTIVFDHRDSNRDHDHD